MTSPPYWGLRNYQIPGQYGLEATVEDYVASLARVFDGLTRVLTPSGTVWLNLADTFGGSWGNYIAIGSRARTASARVSWKQGPQRPPQTRSRAKDLQGVPWRVALALMQRGWQLRRAIVWVKPNARPESARDRLAQRHEMIFVLNLAGAAEPLDTLRVEQEEGSDVWIIPAPRSRWGHVAAGPVALAQRCVRLGCRPGGTVLDPFCGSGTTGLAARGVGCDFVGIDLDPASCALSWRRLTEQRVPR
ncbi:MAG TPA: site-specific DNA-methyltransferase [Pseudonocardiaceae bacterium]|nr:site-specific DNA-methyltransferase [Pseudonocardiaceae bacterium]